MLAPRRLAPSSVANWNARLNELVGIWMFFRFAPVRLAATNASVPPIIELFRVAPGRVEESKVSVPPLLPPDARERRRALKAGNPYRIGGAAARRSLGPAFRNDP